MSELQGDYGRLTPQERMSLKNVIDRFEQVDSESRQPVPTTEESSHKPVRGDVEGMLHHFAELAVYETLRQEFIDTATSGLPTHKS